MKVIRIRTLHGPNLYHNRPVLIATLDLEEKADLGSHQLSEFTRRLIEKLPGLWDHHCSPGHPGGFIERLHRGTYFAHITEHVALELSSQAGIEVSYGKSVYGGAPGIYQVAIRFKNEEGMKHLIHGSVDLLNKLYHGEDYDIARLLQETREIVDRTTLGPSAQALADAATRLQIPWRRIGTTGSLLELGYGRRRQRIQTAVTEETSLIATDLAQDKDLTKKVLSDALIPVPEGKVASSLSEALEIFKTMRRPLAVKPLDGHHGDGVSLNVKTEEELREAFKLASKNTPDVLIECMCSGKDYRILVLNGEVIAAAERIPARVIGDGKSSVRELIEKVNQDPRRGEGHSNTLTRIEINTLLEQCLARQDLTLASVPAEYLPVQLREIANISTGGTSRDVTEIIHPQIRHMCERAARAVGLNLCGIDLIHSDITKPIDENTGIIEVNAGPGLRMHTAPTEGKSHDVAGAIIESIYPSPMLSRIPIVAVTGTNGKTTTVRLIAHLLSKSGFGNIGMTTSDGIDIGGQRIDSGDTTGPHSARAVLHDPTVDTAVLEVARGGIMRGGLGYDWSDVGVITNIRPDHLGQDGIESIEDLVKVKSLIAERVRDGGTIVLNADDPEASRLMDLPWLQRHERKIIYYSLNSTNPLILAHLERGGHAVFVEEGTIVESVGPEKHQLAEVADLSYTMLGAAWFQVANTLAAVAAGLGLGADRKLLARALTSFDNSLSNLGRMNLYRVREGFVLLDYGHNPDALQATADFLKASGKKTIAILGLPGDRSDELLKLSAEVASRAFDRLILRDDHDLRGRKHGEVPNMLKHEIAKLNPALPCEIILDESEALRVSLTDLHKDEVVVMFYDDYESVTKALRAYDPVPVAHPDEFLREAPIRAAQEPHPTRPTSVERFLP